MISFASLIESQAAEQARSSGFGRYQRDDCVRGEPPSVAVTCQPAVGRGDAIIRLDKRYDFFTQRFQEMQGSGDTGGLRWICSAPGIQRRWISSS